jgi:catechol 2,3-dioxygenase-like lactoylglutathione lyase family enzyme
MSVEKGTRAARRSGLPDVIYAITMFVEDLDAARAFYRDVFELPVFFEDRNSVVFKFGDTAVNLLKIGEATSLIAPATVVSRESGVRHQLTLHVENVDRTWEELTRRGVEFLNGPIDRPWGVRTASLRDPAGHIWEIAQPVDPARSSPSARS